MGQQVRTLSLPLSIPPELPSALTCNSDVSKSEAEPGLPSGWERPPGRARCKKSRSRSTREGAVWGSMSLEGLRRLLSCCCCGCCCDVSGFASHLPSACGCSSWLLGIPWPFILELSVRPPCPAGLSLIYQPHSGPLRSGPGNEPLRACEAGGGDRAEPTLYRNGPGRAGGRNALETQTSPHLPLLPFLQKPGCPRLALASRLPTHRCWKRQGEPRRSEARRERGAHRVTQSENNPGQHPATHGVSPLPSTREFPGPHVAQHLLAGPQGALAAVRGADRPEGTWSKLLRAAALFDGIFRPERPA